MHSLAKTNEDVIRIIGLKYAKDVFFNNIPLSSLIERIK